MKIYFKWWDRGGLNTRWISPTDYESAALNRSATVPFFI